MAEDDSTYIYTEDVSESAKPSTPVTKGTLQMSNMSTPVMKPSAKWQRKIKLLPDSIADMTSANSHHLVMSEELDPHSKSKTYGKSLCVVSRVKGIGQNDEDIVLDQLTTDQVCLFFKKYWCPKPWFEEQVCLSHGNCVTLQIPAATIKFWSISHCTGKPNNSQCLQGCQCHL